MRNVTNLLATMAMIFTLCACDTRQIAIDAEVPDFTSRFHTTNLTVAVNSINLLTVEIDGNSYNVYTLRYMTSGNVKMYDRDMVEIEQSVEVWMTDRLYFQPTIPGSFTISFDIENDVGGSDRQEIALTVTE